MGLWDNNVDDSFDSLFDLDGDGKLDPFEQGLQLDAFTHAMEGSNGLEDYEYMDEDERRESLGMFGLDDEPEDD